MVTRCTWRMDSREHTCWERGSTSLQLQHLFRSGISLGFFPAELEERCAGSQGEDELNKNEYFFLLQIFQEWPLDVYVCKAALFCLPQSARRRSEGCGRDPCYETTSEEPKPNLDAVWGLTALFCQTFWISALKRLHCLLSPFSRKDLGYECSRRKDARLRPKNRMFTGLPRQRRDTEASSWRDTEPRVTEDAFQADRDAEVPEMREIGLRCWGEVGWRT